MDNIFYIYIYIYIYILFLVDKVRESIKTIEIPLNLFDHHNHMLLISLSAVYVTCICI